MRSPMKNLRKLGDVIGIGIDVLFFYTPEGFAMFRSELQGYLEEGGWLRWMRRRSG
jgi:hypothetical protein